MKLFIDSSTSFLYLALVKENDIICFIRSGKNDHSETLVDYLKIFLENNNSTIDDVDSIFIGRGPGSYTGLRIAGTVGKVASFIKNKKLYSFSSLDFVLSKAINNDGLYIGKIEANKGHAYYKIVEVKNKNIEVIKDENFGPNDDLIKYSDYNIVSASFDYFGDGKIFAKTILDNSLYKEESNLDYTPNYIRSGI